MRYGFFDDSRREYHITTPDTPLPWINYLGTEDFFALVSNTAGGYAFYKDARLRRLTRYRYNNLPLDQEGFRVYIREGGELWNPGWQPVQTPLDSYCCRHGLGYTIFESAKNGIFARQELFVPRGDNCLLNRIVLENKSSQPRSLELFGCVEFCLWDANDDGTNFQRNYSIGEVEIDGSAIYHKSEYRERRDHYALFWCNRQPDGYDSSREAFFGRWGSAAAPQAVLEGRCTNSQCHGWQPIGAQQLNIKLMPGESYSVIFGLGYVENGADKWEAPGLVNKKKARSMMAKYAGDGDFDRAFQELAAFWSQLLGHFQLQSGDEKLDRMVNIWNQYQCMVTFNMSRSASYFESGMGRGMGFRDSCQDLLGFVHMIPQRARERILDIAATQFPDGSAYHQYQPLTKRGNLAVGSGFNDDPLWLIAGTDAYIRETGDFSILRELVPFDNDQSLAEPLLEHLRRSFNYTLSHLGPHGLPLIGRADWNDCLNLNCFSEKPGESFQTTGPSQGPVAESVFIAGMFVKYGRAWADICRSLGLEEEAEQAQQAVSLMEGTVLDSGWDGDWFIRAYDAFGQPVGSRSCQEGQIFIEPQGMCVMAGIGRDTGHARKALESVRERLETEHGIMLHQPAYTGYRLELGEISSYPPGYKENAGIFCHNNPWISCAQALMGQGEQAWESYRRICPAYTEELGDIHRTEPYVYSQMIAGRDAPSFGEAKNSWLTGTAAWSMLAISQAILGIRPELEGLRIDPCIPAGWKGFSLLRKFRGAEYHISVENPKGVQKGLRELIVDGVDCEKDIIPPAKPGSVVHVRAIMG